MRIERSFLFSYDQTGKDMYKWVELYHSDLGHLLDTSIYDFFDYVKNIPYLEDNPKIELLARPEIIFNHLEGLDCKKKALLIGSWLRGQVQPIPFRFVAVSEDPNHPREPHHVFTQAFLSIVPGDDPEWLNIDPTYPEYQIFEGQPYALYAEELDH